MPLSRSALNIATAAAFTAAVAAGWFSVREQPEHSPDAASRIAALSRSATPARPAKSSSSSPTAATAPRTDAARFERDLAELLDPAAASGGVFSGERMEALFAEYDADFYTSSDFVSAEPPTPGHAYARRWAEHAPQEMFDWFLQRRSFYVPEETYGKRFLPGTILFEVWTDKDPDAALRAAAQWPEPYYRTMITGTAIQVLRKSDPARALAVAAKNLPLFAGASRPLITPQWLAGGYASDDWKFLCDLPPGKMRGDMLKGFLEMAPRAPGGQLLQAWNESPEEIRREVIAAGFMGFDESRAGSREDAPKATGIADARRAAIEQTGDKDLVQEHLQMTVWPWAREDFPAAMAWTQQHLKGRQRVEGAALLYSAAASRDFDAALAAWQALPPGYLRARAAGSLATGAPAARRADVAALLESLSEADRQVAKEAAADAVRLGGVHDETVDY